MTTANIPGPIVQGTSTRGNSLFAARKEPFRPPPPAHKAQIIIIQILPIVNAYELNAEPGSYALTGVAATLLKTSILNASAGAYTVGGVAATLLKTSILNAGTGSYSLSGQAATLLKASILNAGTGDYTLTGVGATLTYAGGGVGPAPLDVAHPARRRHSRRSHKKVPFRPLQIKEDLRPGYERGKIGPLMHHDKNQWLKWSK